jgi:hypothetical protein
MKIANPDSFIHATLFLAWIDSNGFYRSGKSAWKSQGSNIILTMKEVWQLFEESLDPPMGEEAEYEREPEVSEAAAVVNAALSASTDVPAHDGKGVDSDGTPLPLCMMLDQAAANGLINKAIRVNSFVVACESAMADGCHVSYHKKERCATVKQPDGSIYTINHL